MSNNDPNTRRLTAKMDQFARGIALENMDQSASYAKAYNASKMTPKSINEAASRLAADPKVSARIVVLSEGATAVAVKKAGYTMADAMAAARRAEALAHQVSQAGAAVAAVTLQAKLAGHLAEKKEARTGPLDDADVQLLVSMRDEISEKLKRIKELQDLVRETPAAVKMYAHKDRMID